MEISKMLTVSTAHITQTTAEILDDGVRDLIVYKKDEYGWFIVVPESDVIVHLWTVLPNLMTLLAFAKDLGCDWLCLDRDGEVLEYIKSYEW